MELDHTPVHTRHLTAALYSNGQAAPGRRRRPPAGGGARRYQPSSLDRPLSPPDWVVTPSKQAAEAGRMGFEVKGPFCVMHGVSRGATVAAEHVTGYGRSLAHISEHASSVKVASPRAGTARSRKAYQLSKRVLVSMERRRPAPAGLFLLIIAVWTWWSWASHRERLAGSLSHCHRQHARPAPGATAAGEVSHAGVLKTSLCGPASGAGTSPSKQVDLERFGRGLCMPAHRQGRLTHLGGGTSEWVMSDAGVGTGEAGWIGWRTCRYWSLEKAEGLPSTS